MTEDGVATRPTDVSDRRGRFDAVADRLSTAAAKPKFFVGLLVLALIWLALGPVTDFSHGWIDSLQVVAAIITLLVVALLENEQWRNAKATQRKLNAIAEALAQIMSPEEPDEEHIAQLRAAVGLEKRESISD